MTENLGVLLISGTHERAHFAFVLAAGAAAMGRQVVLFATQAGCRALLADWCGIDPEARDAVVRARGVAGLDELRQAARELGVRLLICEAGLRGEALEGEPILAGAEIAGVATFLEAVGSGQIVSV